MSTDVRGGVKYRMQPDSSGHSVMMVWCSCDFCCIMELLLRGGVFSEQQLDFGGEKWW
jgi:hypothetical protein